MPIADPPPTTKRAGALVQGRLTTPIIVAILSVVAVWFFAIQTVLTERDAKLRAGKAKADELASILESRTLHVIAYADTYLKAARREYARRGELSDLRGFLRDVPMNNAILSHLTIINGAGKPIFISTDDAIAPTASATDRDYFNIQKAAEVDEMYISQLRVGRSTGFTTLRLVRRIEMASGAFSGVIFASIKPETIIEALTSHQIGHDDIVGLVGLDRRARIWATNDKFLPDYDIGSFRLWDALSDAPVGMFREKNSPGGQDSDFAYRQLRDYPLITIIGIARANTLQTVSGFAWTAFAIALLATLVITVMTTSVIRDARLVNSLQREVSVRRRAEKEALRASEVKASFLATMSHEVRTPINAILGLFELIEQADVPERQKRQARAGQQAASDLFKQLTNVLDVSRLEAKSLELSIRNEPLRPLIVELHQLLEASIVRSGKLIDATVAIDESVPESAWIDRRRVDQIVLNLIENAVKFTDTGRIGLSVTTYSSGVDSYLCIAVSDTGPGIPKHSIPQLFERFSQLDGAITRRAGGSGLGLSISKELAKLMQGNLQVRSVNGVGTTFELHLPLSMSGSNTTIR